jgi:hypothetical protein
VTSLSWAMLSLQLSNNKNSTRVLFIHLGFKLTFIQNFGCQY